MAEGNGARWFTARCEPPNEHRQQAKVALVRAAAPARSDDPFDQGCAAKEQS